MDDFIGEEDAEHLKESVMATPMMMKMMTMITLPAGSLPAPLPEPALHNQNHQTTRCIGQLRYRYDACGR